MVSHQNALPPAHAVLLISTLSFLCFWHLPSLKSIDEIATTENFTTSVIPSLSLPILGLVRICCGLVALGSAFDRMTGPGSPVKNAYLPNSKLIPNEKMDLKGLRALGSYTWWSFVLLGLSFLGSSCITFLFYANMESYIHPWLLRFSFLSFEVSAPNAFLVSSAVRYALWPTFLKKHGPTGTLGFKSFHGLVTHNLNVIFVMVEVCLLGGLPVLIEHMTIAPWLGILYVLFSWFMMTRWTPDRNPTTLYFFLDPTLGPKTSLALLALIMVLITFYILFSLLDKFLLSLMGAAILPRLLACIGISSCVCRFRD